VRPAVTFVEVAALVDNGWQEGVLEQLAAEAGLCAESRFDLSYPFLFEDEDALARRLLAPGPIVAAAQTVGADALREAIVEAMAPCRTPAGGYRVENEWHALMCRA
jgi:hypothetical protein